MNTPVIEMKGIVKNFPGVKALDNVNFTVNENEVLGLVGENGAGKSTLMKILVGLYKIDGGSFLLRGQPATYRDPLHAINEGIGMVFQEGCLIPNLTVAENLFLCHEGGFKKTGLINLHKVNEEAKTQLEKLGVKVNPKTYVRDISPAMRQMVEIARLLWLAKMSNVKNPVLILDEPTTVLLEDEIDRLFAVIEEVKKESSIIFISHRLEEVLTVSDRIEVFRDGKNSASFSKKDASVTKIEASMVGHEMSETHFRENEQKSPKEDVVFELEHFGKKGDFEPIDIKLHAGEILSITGVLGSGKESLCRCLAGIEQPTSGTLKLHGKLINLRNVKSAIAAGIGYIPIDRRKEGLALQLDVGFNINFLILKKMAKAFLISPKKEKDTAKYWVDFTKVKTPNIKVHCSKLSGGNQQKVVIAKWLASKTEVLILDHPTRGIDVGAKDEIYHRIRLLADQGLAIIIMSDRLEEDIGLCNRMIMMKDGKVTGQLECPPEHKPSPLDIISHIV